MARITQWRPTRTGIIVTLAIIVLAVIVGIGLYIFKQQGEQARREDAVKVAEQNLNEQSKQGVALNQGGDANKDQSQSGASDQQSNQSQSSLQSQDAQQAQNNSSAQPTGNGASELPQTGPEDTLPLIALALLTFAVASYVQSRRSLQN